MHPITSTTPNHSNKHIATGISREGELVSVWKVGSYGQPEVHVVRTNLDKPGASVVSRPRDQVADHQGDLMIQGVSRQEIITVDRTDRSHIRLMLGSTLLEPMTQYGEIIMPDLTPENTPVRTLAEV